MVMTTRDSALTEKNSFVIQTTDGGGGEHVHFVLDRKESDEQMWLMPGEHIVRYLSVKS